MENRRKLLILRRKEIMVELSEINNELECKPNRKMYNINDIIDIVSAKAEFNLRSKDRHKKYSISRFAMFKFFKDNYYGVTEIGEAFNRNHATVISGLRVYDDLKYTTDFQVVTYRQIILDILQDIDINQ